MLIVGLGNPGAEYARTRHNIGFMAVEEIAGRYRFGPWKNKFQGRMSDGVVDGVRTMILEPLTFMNDSGRSVLAAVSFHKIPLQDVVVVHDDLDLPAGKVRVKKGGGHGGHNGLRSIDAHLGKDYWRVRLGIGRPEHKDAVVGWVLHDFAKSDTAWLDPLIAGVAENAPLLATGRPDEFMNKMARISGVPEA